MRKLRYRRWLSRLEIGLQQVYGRFLWLIEGRRSPLRGKSFEYRGAHLPYFLHPYNHTWSNERTIEVAIARHELRDADGLRVLEIGRVLGHYQDAPWVVLDKHELGSGVLNVDIVDYRPAERYHRIVSLSTFEHIGIDETPRDDSKVLRAIQRARELLAPGGRAILSWPVGWNPTLDRVARAAPRELGQLLGLKRVSADNEWRTVAVDEALQSAYGSPYRYANAIVVCTIDSVVGP